MTDIEWVIKPSTFCNLRCRYCYEWNGLSDRNRMSPDVWRRVVNAIFQYHRKEEERRQKELVTRIIWHGGEPLALPHAYFESLLREQRHVAHNLGVPAERIVTCAQTNLTLLSTQTLELIRNYDLRLGVSMDVVRGVRLDPQGRETESRVLEN